MMSLLHAVTGPRNGPKREESGDADHEVEQVKHEMAPCSPPADPWGSELDEHRNGVTALRLLEIGRPAVDQ